MTAGGERAWPRTAAPARSAGLVLAAGEARRFGGPKQLASLDGKPLIEHALAALAKLDRVVVVLGARAADIRACADLGGAEVVIVLADQPFVTAAAVERVRAAAGPAARAVYGGAPGHPVVVRGPLLERAGELRGDAGFRELLDDAAGVECSDLGDPHDIDTRDDLEVVRR